MDLNDKQLVNKLFKYIKNLADDKELDAGMGGFHHDGGASRLRSEVQFYQMGMNKVIPPQWKDYVKDIVRKDDPEYVKYLELKQKFE